MVKSGLWRQLSFLIAVCLVLIWTGCSSVDPDTPQQARTPTQTGDFGDPGGTPEVLCQISFEEVFDGGVGKDGIPALTNPERIPAIEVDFLADTDRVLGIELDGQWVATPHSIMWWHEIVNFDGKYTHVAVSYCPLTGSGIAFDRSIVENAEFGVSGLLFETNLIMYDRTDAETLWSQMSREGSCGPHISESLPQIPIVDMTWLAWRKLHPLSTVVSTQTGHRRDYTRYPYGGYEAPENSHTLFPVSEIDPRRPPKERVLGVPFGSGGLAFPFGVLDGLGEHAAVNAMQGGIPVAVLWNREAQTAVAFNRWLDAGVVELIVKEGKIVDRETGSEFRLDGRAISGPLAGSRLEGLEDAYVSFWFAWAVFQPDTEIWISDD